MRLGCAHAPRLPIGTSDFTQLRRDGLRYVDKSGIITELVTGSSRALLLPRPRRFGKTLNMTMMRAFFDRETPDAPALFEGLAVMEEGEEVLRHMGRHPVIFLTLKDVKHPTWEACKRGLVQLLAAEVLRLRSMALQAPLPPETRALFDALAQRSADLEDYQLVLSLLGSTLQAATGEQVVLLIDEYDSPIHSGFAHGYYEEVVGFFRNLLSAGLKDAGWLYRGVLTGILRVATESIFSGLNNIDVHSMLSPRFDEWFGFTSEEVTTLAREADQEDLLPTLEAWFNGYRMGRQRLYNPWSVLSQLSRPGASPQAWWVNTASNELLRELLVSSGLGLQDDLGALLRGEAIQRPVSEDIVLREVRQRADALWSFLLFSGYLTVLDPFARDGDGRPASPLVIPNHEVSIVYRTVFRGWMEASLSAWSGAPAQLGRALLGGDESTFRQILQRLILESLSYFDLASRRPEAVYQAFIVGLLVHLEETHEVRPNRESGFGRYDVMVRPKQVGQAGAVLELKVIDTEDGETAEQGLDAAMAQVRNRAYATELRAAGAAPVWVWAGVFDGKRAWVRVEEG